MASFTGGSGADTLTGTAERDYFAGGGGNDTIDSGGGNDWIEGGAGADTFVFRPGCGWDCVGDFRIAEGDRLDLRGWTAIRSTADLTIQADGSDTVILFGPNDGVRLMGVASSSLTASQFLFAGTTTGGTTGGTTTPPTGAPTEPPAGTPGRTLTGTGARDNLIGGAGNDTITAGGGYDYMEGGAGSDTFVCAPGDSWDYIQDFQAGTGGDVLDLRAWSGIRSLADITISSDATGTSLVFGPNDGMRLNGVQPGALTAANFRFAAAAPAGGTLSIGPASVSIAEGVSGTTPVLFTVTRSGDLSGAATVAWSVAGSGAAAATAADFAGGALPSGRLSFAAGQATATISVPVLADALAEADERFTVTLAEPSAGWSLGTASALGVIVNDDNAAGGGTPGRVLGGTSGRDELYGTAGNDTISGGAGNDYMDGHGGSDVFVVNPGDGWDAIGGFQAGAGGDMVDLRGWAGLSFDALLAAATEDGSGTMLTLGGGTGVRLTGVGKASLTRGNVLLAGDAPPSSGPAITGMGWTPASFDATAVTRVSTTASGTQANARSTDGVVSPDGRYVAFLSDATNLSDADTNGATDLFLKDTQTGAVRVIASGSAHGGLAYGFLSSVAFSADGTSLLYASRYSGTSYGDYGRSAVHIQNLETGSLQTVNLGASYLSNLQLSADGRYLTYQRQDIARMSQPTLIDHVDLETGAKTIIAGPSTPWSGAHSPVLSPDGRSVAYADFYGVYLRDMETGTQTRLTVLPDGSTATYPVTGSPHAFSADGRYVLFSSAATVLVDGDGNGVQDVFVRDLQTGTTRLVSTAADGSAANGASTGLRFSADGRHVLFTSTATNLVEGDTNGQADLFLKDLETGAVRRVNIAADGTQANAGTIRATMSADGSRVVYSADASNLVGGDSNGASDIFAVDVDKLGTGNPREPSAVNLTIGFAAGSAAVTEATVAWGDGQTTTHTIATGASSVAAAHQYVGSGRFTGTVTLRDQSGATISDSFSAQIAASPDALRVASVGVGGSQSTGASYGGVLSGDGRFLAFDGYGPNITGTTQRGLVVKNLQTGALTLASAAADGTPGNQGGGSASLSRDGRWVAFASASSNLVAGDSNGQTDVFVKDMQTGAITQVSAAADGTRSNGRSANPTISADGRFVTFVSGADNLVAGDTNGADDVFVKDLQTGTIVRASVRVDGGGGLTSGSGAVVPNSFRPSISEDGRWVLFTSYASDLVPNDTGTMPDAFLKDLHTGALTRVNTAADGTVSNGTLYHAAISADGRYAAFASSANNLGIGAAGNHTDIFVKDLQTGTLRLASTAADGTAANGSSGGYEFRLSADGRYVAFVSDATNLVADDTNGRSDTFLKDMVTGEVTRIGPLGPQPSGQSGLDYPTLSDDGRYVAGTTYSDALARGDTNGYQDVLLFDRLAGLSPLTGGAGRDVLVGNVGDDVLIGEDGDDVLSGGLGADLLVGGVGSDVLAGGAGDDTLTGGLGADVFAFGIGSGSDVVTDFSVPDGDRLQIGVGQSWTVGSTGSGDARISFGMTDSVTLIGVRPDQVGAGLFITG